jgi:hypothetical protein
VLNFPQASTKPSSISWLKKKEVASFFNRFFDTDSTE